MEREAKYRALERIKAKQIEACDFSPYTLGERQTHELRDTLLDTADHILSEARHSLRIRRDGSITFLTLKMPGSVEGAVHARPEIEAEITADMTKDRSQWSQDIVEPVNTLIGDAELTELLSIRNRRRVWAIMRDETLIAELALDRGIITANTRKMPFHEIELELKGEGNDDDLVVLTDMLVAALPLASEPKSKMQRGLELLNHTEHYDLLKAFSERTPMTATANLAEAGRAMLAKNLAKLYDAWGEAYRGDEPEGVHQMRVATRRLRAILALLGESVYDQKTVRRLRRGLREWASDLGVVRDADVFLLTLDEYEATLNATERDQLQPLRDAVTKERDEGREILVDFMDSRKAAKFAHQLEQFVLTEGAGVVKHPDDDTMPQVLVREWVASLAWQHYEIIRAYETRIDGAPLATLHRLRIEIKHLRYVLEFFRDALAPETDALIEILVAAQDHFGNLNDADVAIMRVDKVLNQHPANELLQQYRAAQVAKREELVAGAPKVARTIWDLTFRRRLGAIVSKV